VRDENRKALLALQARRRLGEKSPILEREIHARVMLGRARRKLKLAATLIRRWQRKVRYYERRTA